MLLELNSELIQVCTLHLQPRHLFKLMQTNKKIYAIVKAHDYYYERLAVFYAYRFEDIKISKSLRYMVNLPLGYSASMDIFIQIIKEYLLKQCNILAHTCMDILLAYNNMTEQSVMEHHVIKYEVTAMNVIMHEIEMMKDHLYTEKIRLLFKWSQDLDDNNTLSMSNKVLIASKLSKCFVYHDEIKSNDTGDLGRDLAIGIYGMMLQEAQHYDRFHTYVQKWIHFMTTEIDIEWPLRIKIMNQVLDILTKGYYDIKVDKSSDLISFYMAQINAKSSFIKEIRDAIWATAPV
jgi:hypothetical protein